MQPNRPPAGQAPGAGAGSQPNSTLGPRGNVWQHPQATNSLISSLAAARGPPGQVPRPKSAMMNPLVTPSRLANQVSQMSVAPPPSQQWDPSSATYNPSCAPAPSQMTINARHSVAPTQQQSIHSNQSAQIPASKLCVLGKFKPHEFKLGDILGIPFHVPNTNPKVDPADRNLTITSVGPAYSKRRMVVVLFIYAQDMYCLPLYSFSGRGLGSKPVELRHQFVCVRNVTDTKFVNPGKHQPIVVKTHRALDATTTIALAGGVKVGFKEDSTYVGRCEKQSYKALVSLWKVLVQDAQQKVQWN